jgi:vacuolar protein-sorting-associated protein 4
MQKGIELAKEAVEEDNKQNWQQALDLYKRALEYFTTHLKYDKNPKSRQMITAKVGVGQACQFAAG